MTLNFLEKIPTLETENYILKELKITDAEHLFDMMSDKHTMKFVTAHPVKSMEELEEKIAYHLNNFKNKKEIPWAIFDKKSEKTIGILRLHKIHLWHRKCEIGSYIHKDFQKQGVMTELVPTILAFCFQDLHLNRVVGDTFAGNIGSIKLLERFGFHKDGVLRQTDFDGENFHDTIVYSLLRDEYFVQQS